MGLISGLLLLPVTAPARSFRFLIEQLRDEADSVMNDEGRAFAELIDASMRHSAGQLSDAEFAEQESALLARLNAIREERDAARSQVEWDDADDALDAGGDEPLDDDALDFDADESDDDALDEDAEAEDGR